VYNKLIKGVENMLKCSKCKNENIYSADYCINCGYQFEEIEKKTAKLKTTVGKLEWIEDKFKDTGIKDILNKKFPKIVGFIVLILINVWIFYKDNKDFKLLESDTYQIEHKASSNEYYLLIKDEVTESISVELYAPKRMKNLSIQKENQEKEILETIDYRTNKKVMLNRNGKNDYYLFNITYRGNKTEQIKVYVYGGM